MRRVWNLRRGMSEESHRDERVTSDLTNEISGSRKENQKTKKFL